MAQTKGPGLLFSGVSQLTFSRSDEHPAGLLSWSRGGRPPRAASAVRWALVTLLTAGRDTRR